MTDNESRPQDGWPEDWIFPNLLGWHLRPHAHMCGQDQNHLVTGHLEQHGEVVRLLRRSELPCEQAGHCLKDLR
jgi:hypothetical protein